MVQTLPLSNIINVTILPTAQSLSTPAINTAALFTRDTPAWTDTYRLYTNATDVGTDFGTASNTFKIAVAFFAQQPNVLATQGYLAIIPRLSSTTVKAGVAIQDIYYQAVSAGTSGNATTIAYTTGATAGQEVVTVVGSAISIQIAAGVSTAYQVQTAFYKSAPAVALATATVIGVGSNPQTAPVSATNLAGGSASGSEPVQDAIIRTLNTVFYFGVLVDEEYFATPVTLRSLAAYVQGLQKVLFYASSHTADIAAGGLLDLVRQSSDTQTRLIYYNDGTAIDTPAFAAAYAARALSTNFSGSRTASTMNLKQLANFTPDNTLNETLYVQAQAAGVDIYGNNAGVPGLLTSGANGWWDQIYGQFWLVFAMSTAGFNFLATTQTKIPQTEVGMSALKSVYIGVLQQGVSNGFIAAGAWNSSTVFGNPADLIRNVGDYGYYVYSQPVNQQVQADRTARKAPLIQIAFKCAGAIHSSNVQVNVNQ